MTGANAQNLHKSLAFNIMKLKHGLKKLTQDILIKRIAGALPFSRALLKDIKTNDDRGPSYHTGRCHMTVLAAVREFSRSKVRGGGKA